jgi:serine/threonine protein kinase
MLKSTSLDQFINNSEYKYTHDLYSVALTICDLITGQTKNNPNYDRKNNSYNQSWEDWMLKVCTKAPKLGIILKRMLSFYPPHRYQSALEVLLIVRAIAWRAWVEDKWLIKGWWLIEARKKFKNTDDFFANTLIQDFLKKSEDHEDLEAIKKI